MLAALGPFVFLLQTAPFQERRRSTSWRLPQQSRVGARPAVQFLGPGDETVQLSGVLMPEITGGTSTLEALRTMAAMGTAWPLIDAGGLVFGLYVLESIEETAGYIMDGGFAQRIEFSISLRRTDDYNSVADLAAGGADKILSLF